MAGNLQRLVRDLQRRKARERRELIVAEGRRLVEDALASGVRIRGVVIGDDAPGGAAVGAAAEQRGVAVERVSRTEFDALADTATPSGVLAVVEWSPLALAGLPAAESERPLLVLDAVQDPGNVGTMIRTAFALGAWATVALEGTADVRNAKVARGSMGALFRHPVAVAGMDELASWLAAQRREVFLAAMAGEPVRSLHDTRRATLVVGSEGHGVRDAWATISGTRRLAIPMVRDAESLNAAVAAGILLYELCR